MWPLSDGSSTTDMVSWQRDFRCGTIGVMTSLSRLLVFLFLVLLAGCDAPPEIDSKLTMIAQMPLQVQDRLLVVPAGINGHWVRLVVDSGAERTMISNATAERLGLRTTSATRSSRWASAARRRRPM